MTLSEGSLLGVVALFGAQFRLIKGENVEGLLIGNAVLYSFVCLLS